VAAKVRAEIVLPAIGRLKLARPDLSDEQAEELVVAAVSQALQTG